MNYWLKSQFYHSSSVSGALQAAAAFINLYRLDFSKRSASRNLYFWLHPHNFPSPSPLSSSVAVFRLLRDFRKSSRIHPERKKIEKRRPEKMMNKFEWIWNYKLIFMSLFPPHSLRAARQSPLTHDAESIRRRSISKKYERKKKRRTDCPKLELISLLLL